MAYWCSIRSRAAVSAPASGERDLGTALAIGALAGVALAFGHLLLATMVACSATRSTY